MGRVGKIHFVCLALALLDLFLFYNWAISFRGQWFDILLSVAPIITATNVMFNRFGLLPVWGQVYFVGMPFINLLLTPIYIFGTVVFPLTTYAEAGNYEARSRPGMLSSAGINLIKKTFIFERMTANIDLDYENAPENRIRIEVGKDSVGLTLPWDAGRDTTIFFRK